MDWRKGVEPAKSAHVYQAGLICGPCAANLRHRLEREAMEKNGGRLPSPWPPEDSDDFPQGPFPNGGGEADYVAHCDNHSYCAMAIRLPMGHSIGIPLGNPLTTDGVKDLIERIADAITRGEHAMQVARLQAYLYMDWLDGVPIAEVPLRPDSLVASDLARLLEENSLDPERYRGPAYTDCQNLYGTILDGDSLAAFRCGLNSLGRLSGMDIIRLPASEFGSSFPDEIISMCLEEDAWE